MKLPILTLLVVVACVGGGCKKPPKPKDCGDDKDCFIAAAEACKPATLLLHDGGKQLQRTVRRTIVGPFNDRCEMHHEELERAPDPPHNMWCDGPKRRIAVGLRAALKDEWEPGMKLDHDLHCEGEDDACPRSFDVEDGCDVEACRHGVQLITCGKGAARSSCHVIDGVVHAVRTVSAKGITLGCHDGVLSQKLRY